MSELKIKTRTTYIYETSDGREFESESEAEAWEGYLNIFKTITMLDYKFRPTKVIDAVFYVYIETWEQLETFMLIQDYFGITARIDKPGYYYYDEAFDKYIDISRELVKLHDMIEALDSTKK